MVARIQAYQQLQPCVAPGSHSFIASHPPAGQWGTVTILCQRCGKTPEQLER